jgi:hypothetical protein
VIHFIYPELFRIPSKLIAIFHSSIHRLFSNKSNNRVNDKLFQNYTYLQERIILYGSSEGMQYWITGA